MHLDACGQNVIHIKHRALDYALHHQAPWPLKRFGEIDDIVFPAAADEYFVAQGDDMEATDLVSLIELLDDKNDDLEDALESLMSSPLVDTASKLPVLDKAQLYVLITYAIESLLFGEYNAI